MVRAAARSIGWLDDDDVSLTYDAARREVRRHAGGTSEVVGDDICRVLESSMAPGEQWFGYLGYACRPDLPARPDPALPDAVWMRPSHVRSSSTRRRRSSESPLQPGTPARVRPMQRPATVEGRPAGGAPEAYAAAFAHVQEHLRAGNSYEVNLTYRLSAEADLDPAATYLRLRDLNPAPYAGFLQHDVEGAPGVAAQLQPRALRPGHRRPHHRDQADQGHRRPRGATAERGRGAARRALARDPKTRAENLMIVDLLRNDLGDGLRGRLGRGAGADGRRVLRVGAPARLDGPRPAPRRRHDGRGAAGAVPAPAR